LDMTKKIADFIVKTDLSEIPGSEKSPIGAPEIEKYQ